MSDYLIHNGVLLPKVAYHVSASNRAFRFGDALFETFRISNHVPLYVDEHLSRLSHGMRVLRMDYHSDFELETFLSLIHKLLALNNLHDARMRLSVYRNDGGLYSPTDLTVSYILESWQLEESNYMFNTTGLKITLYSELLKPINALGSFKSLNTSLYTLAGLYAKDCGCDDAILLNQHGEICEATSSNVFYWKNGIVYTPPLSSGCVAGIMRLKVLQLCDFCSIPYAERQTSILDLVSADEIFLTNAARGIAWVQSFKDKVYVSEKTELLLTELNNNIS